MAINIAHHQRNNRAEASSATFRSIYSILILALFALGLWQNRQGNVLYGARSPLEAQSVGKSSSDLYEPSFSTWPGIPAHHLSLVAENNQGPPLVRKATLLDGSSIGPVSNAREYFLEHLDEFLQVY